MVIMILIEEKSSVSLADRLDEVVIKAGYELAFSGFPCNINSLFPLYDYDFFIFFL